MITLMPTPLLHPSSSSAPLAGTRMGLSPARRTSSVERQDLSSLEIESEVKTQRTEEQEEQEVQQEEEEEEDSEDQRECLKKFLSHPKFLGTYILCMFIAYLMLTSTCILYSHRATAAV